MESLGIPENDIARWAGLASSTFSLCQAMTGLLWGAASDRYGRKPVILFGLFNTMWTMLLWGFAVSLPMALAARALQGLTNGNVGILRTTVAELSPWKELQPRAFSVMPLVYTVGAIVGPTLGGALSNPLRVDPRKPRGTAFLERFPYVLPNLVAAIFFTISILVGWLFLRETLESKRRSPDLGIRVGERLTRFAKSVLGLRSEGKEEELGERAPLLGQSKVNDEMPAPPGIANQAMEPTTPRMRDVLTYQTMLNLVVYTLLALYTLAFDQVCLTTFPLLPWPALLTGAPAAACVHAPPAPSRRLGFLLAATEVLGRFRHRCAAHRGHLHPFRHQQHGMSVPGVSTACPATWGALLSAHRVPHLPRRLLCDAVHRADWRRKGARGNYGDTAYGARGSGHVCVSDEHDHADEQRDELACLGHDQRAGDEHECGWAGGGADDWGRAVYVGGQAGVCDCAVLGDECDCAGG